MYLVDEEFNKWREKSNLNVKNKTFYKGKLDINDDLEFFSFLVGMIMGDGSIPSIYEKGKIKKLWVTVNIFT